MIPDRTQPGQKGAKPVVPIGSRGNLRHAAGCRFEKIDDERVEPVSRPFMNPGPGLLFGASTRRIIAGRAAAGVVDGRTQRRQRLEGNRLVRMFGSHRADTGLGSGSNGLTKMGCLAVNTITEAASSSRKNVGVWQKDKHHRRPRRYYGCGCSKK
jgi:hypothetical protein